jgi:hypothetical protein
MFRYHHLMRRPRVPASPSKYFKPTIHASRSCPTAPSPARLRNTTTRFGMPTGHSPAATATPIIGPSPFQEARQSEATSPSSQPQRSNNDLDVNEGVSRVVHHAVCDLCDSDIRGHRYVSLKHFYLESHLNHGSSEMPCLPGF